MSLRAKAMLLLNLILIIGIIYKEITTRYDFRSITNGTYDIIDSKIIHHVDRVDMKSIATYPIKNDFPLTGTTINSISYYHGFGCNSLSFQSLIDSMVKQHHNKVNFTSYLHTAHDIPGFGMGIRDSNIYESFQPMFYRPYWNAKVGNLLMNKCYNKYLMNTSINKQGIRNKIFFAHSMGAVAGLIAASVESYNRLSSDDENIIVILESPAILLSSDQHHHPHHLMNGEYSNNATNLIQKAINNTSSKLSVFVSKQQQNVQKCILPLRILIELRKLMTQIIIYPLRLFGTLLLRSRFFWIQGLQSAYSRISLKNHIDNQVYDNYRLAAYAYNFDIDLINFIKAQTSIYNKYEDSIGCAFPTSYIIPNISSVDVILSLIRSKSTIIFIHGYEDNIINHQNSIRIVNHLRSVLNESEQKYLQLILLNDTGHVPHEENVDTIVSILSTIV